MSGNRGVPPVGCRWRLHEENSRRKVLNVWGDSSDIQQGQVVTNTILVTAVGYASSRDC